MTIRIQTNTRNHVRYISVVQDLHQNGERRIRTLKSFGPESPEALARAHQFKANCEAALAVGEKLPQDQLWETLMVVFGLVLGLAVLNMLFRSE